MKYALFSPENGDAGDGASGGGGNPEDEQPNKDVVPKTQFIAAINSANAKYDALKAELDALRAEAKGKVPEQKRYTRAELSAMVTAGQATQEQADAQMDFQLREEAKAEAGRVATETVSQAQRKHLVDSEIAKYKVLAPEILDETHETRDRIKEEYQYLIGLGDSNSVETQLKAIRAVLGPLDRLERARSGRKDVESHQETGGDGSSKNKTPKSLVDTLSVREKDYYGGMIQKGQYKDWKAVEDELKFARPDIRRKAGARV